MHEERLLRDLRREIEAIAAREGPGRIVRVDIRLGALSHFTAAEFRRAWPRAVDGTSAHDAILTVEESRDPTAPDAQAVMLLRVVVEDGSPARTSATPPRFEAGAPP
jgi:Zn finger protein HypA/HybF involved in hydrogenase expression